MVLKIFILDNKFIATCNTTVSEYSIGITKSGSNSYIKENILSYLYKTAKEYKTDIASFGRLGLKDYLTWQDWVDSNWASNYQNSFFSVNVNSTIQSGQLFTKI